MIEKKIELTRVVGEEENEEEVEVTALVEFEFETPEPPSRDSPGDPGGPIIEKVTDVETGEELDLTEQEKEEIEEKIWKEYEENVSAAKDIRRIGVARAQEIGFL